MKKIITLLLMTFLTFGLSSCVQTDSKLETAEVTNGCTDYEVKFLFEVDGIKVYRFMDNGRFVYFTNREGKTKYEYTTRVGNVTTHRALETECN